MRKSPSSSPISRDWMQVFAIYGVGEGKTLAFLVFHATFFASTSLLSVVYFSRILSFIHSLPLLAFVTIASALTALYLLFAAARVFHSSLGLHWVMCQRIVASVPDWSSVRTALDVGCGRGILLNSVAMQLKKAGSCGRVVGLDHRRETAVAALRTASVEGVEKYVTCREADARKLPFPDGYFDVVVSAVHLSWIGKETRVGTTGLSPAAEAERGKAVAEVVRVLMPGGVGVVWDLVCVPEYARKLVEMGMEDVKVSERVTAYMVGSHIVSFKKPKEMLDEEEEMEAAEERRQRPVHRRVNMISSQ